MILCLHLNSDIDFLLVGHLLLLVQVEDVLEVVALQDVLHLLWLLHLLRLVAPPSGCSFSFSPLLRARLLTAHRGPEL